MFPLFARRRLARPPEAGQMLKTLFGDGESARSAWQSLLAEIRAHYGDVSEAVGKNLTEPEILSLLEILLLITIRNGFVSGERVARLFETAQAMGAHLLPVHYDSPVPDTRSVPPEVFSRDYQDLHGWSMNEAAQLETLRSLASFVPSWRTCREWPVRVCSIGTTPRWSKLTPSSTTA